MENVNLENAILYASDRHGVYIPQHFAESVNRYSIACWSNWVSDLDELCKGPDECEHYWDIWDDVLNRMELHDDKTGIDYVLWQDGDLWLVPINDMQVESE